MTSTPPPPAAADLPLRERVRLLSGGDFWHTARVTGVDPVRMSDGPHGMRVQLATGDHLGLSGSEPSTCFPPAVTLASTWDPDLVAEVGAATAEEAKALGVSLVLGPGLNLKRHPACGRNFEYFSEDPLVSGVMAAAMVRGIQSRGIGACVKHFAVNNAEDHRFVADSVVDPRTLHELYLSGFEHVVRQADPWAVMASYNLVDGEQVTQSRRLLTEVLREEWGWDGLVVSDWGATADRAAGVRAGMDLEMPGGGRLNDAEVLAAVAAGSLAESEVTRSAQRVLDLVARSPHPEPDRAARTALHDDHDALARRVAAAGSVLLTNDGILPLDPAARIGVVGAFAAQPRYQGIGSSMVTPTRTTSLLDACAERGIEVGYAPGYDPDESGPDAALVDEAVQLARSVEVVVLMLGLPGPYESEGFDRDHLDLPEQHVALLEAVCAANPRTVVVLSHGSPVTSDWHERPAAVLEAYLGGQAGGAAVADVLLGDAEPGGRLAESFPVRAADLAAHAWFRGTTPRQVQYREGLLVGYRHLTTAGVPARWPFGHGLGYTTFDWTAPRVDRNRIEPGDPLVVEVTVTNTGDRAGSDVVQVYRRDRTGAVTRPRRELVGFAKVRLAPGESAVVRVELTDRALAHHDGTRWQVAPGRYDLEVARSSEAVVHVLDVAVGVAPGTPPAPDRPVTVAEGEAEFVTRYGRALPEVVATRPFTRNSTIEELAVTSVGRLLAAGMRRASPVGAEDLSPGTRLMIERSMAEMPLRAAATFSAGALSWPVVDLLLDLANGRYAGAARRTGGLVVAGVRRALRRR